jgi:hypothetical protein
MVPIGPCTPGVSKEEVNNGLPVVLACPDYSCRFYLKMDWSKHDGMAAVLCQADSDCPE